MLIKKIINDKSFVKPERLPPTEEATKYHSYRVYQQVQVWRGKEINPIDWGWIVSNNMFLPKMTDLPPAPPSFVNEDHAL